jgi:stage V sporulation protein SpoVS
MSAVVELRLAAGLMREVHHPGCEDYAGMVDAANLLDEEAAAVEVVQAQLGPGAIRGQTLRRLSVARKFLATQQEVAACAS